MAVLQRVETHAGVERLRMAYAPAGKPLYWTSAYLADGVLIDSGCARCRSALVRFIATRKVEAALTTHEHEDHVGNHAALDVPVWAPRRAVEILDEGPPRLPFYRWITWGGHERAPGARALGDVATPAGRRYRVLPTPGHSADHVVFLDEARSAVFTGDAYFGKLRAVRAKEDVPQQMESLRRLADLDPAVLYPTHGPIVERPRAKLLETVEHFERLRGKARRLADEGRSPRQIRQDLLGPEPWLTYFSMGAFSAENLILSLLRDSPDARPRTG